MVGYRVKLAFDKIKPDGAPEKLIDIARLKNMGWEYSVDMESVLKEVYKWHLESCK